MKYTIGTGYYNSKGRYPWAWDSKDPMDKPTFFNLWLENTLKFSKPEQIVVVDASMNAEKPSKEIMDSVCWIPLKDNLGHTLDMDHSTSYQRYSGWSTAFLITGLIAYNNKTDFIFKEQDCLAFNDWIGEFYKSHGYNMLVGRENSVYSLIVEHSLLWVKWEYIPEILSQYMMIRNPDGGPNYVRTEHKFARIKENYPSEIGYFDFGYGRCDVTELPKNNSPFYMQQVSNSKLRLLKENSYI